MSCAGSHEQISKLQEHEEQIFEKVRKILRNKIVSIKEQEYHILEGKPANNIKRSIYLLCARDKDNNYTLENYSLWYVEPKDTGDDKFRNIAFWRYDGEENKEELLKELFEKFLEHAYEDD